MIDQAFQLFDQILNFKNQSLLLNGKMKEIVFQDVEHEKSLTEKNGSERWSFANCLDSPKAWKWSSFV